MTETALPEVHFGGTSVYTTFDNDFTPTVSGYYYFGIHCVTKVGEGTSTKVANFSVTEATPKIIPPAAGNMTYTLAPNGELKANVVYTAPTKDTKGEDLTKISKVVIKTNWKESHTFTEVTPGQVINFETELNHSPYNRLEAIAYVEDKAGESVIIKDFYAGLDNPLPVKNLKIKLSDDFNSVVLTWDPVTSEGEQGGYVPTEKIQYYVFDAFGSYIDPAIMSTTETTATIDLSALQGQDFVAYQVTAGYDETYYSVESTSGIVVAGTPERLPYHESFANAYYSQIWAVDPTSGRDVYNGTVNDNELQTNADDYEAAPIYLNSHDGDNGFFFFMPMAKDAKYGFFSAKIDVSTATNPVLEFYAQGKGSQLDALISRDGGDFEVVKGIDFKAEPTQDWTLYRVDLSSYKNSKYIQIELRLTAKDNTEETMWSVPVDNIRVIDLAAKDVRVSTLAAPTSIKVGEASSVVSVIENIGSESAENIEVSLLADGKVVETKTIANMASGEVAKLPFAVSASATSPDAVNYYVEAVLTGDKSTNNEAEATVKIKHSTLPQVGNVKSVATSDGKVHVSWEAPDFAELTKPKSVVEDFESADYAPFAKDGFGAWSVIDVDGKKTYTFLKDENNPYRTQPMAFQLFTTSKAGMPADYLQDMPPHSGETQVVAFSAQGQNDNWLVSPELTGAAQTVSFFARSFSVRFPESFEVYYSMGGKGVADFVKVESVENYPADNVVAEDWTVYKVALPVGAKYFAIRHTAYDSYVLCLDDFKFEAAGVYPSDLAIEGYKVYRNHDLVSNASNSPLVGTEYTDIPGSKGKYAYHVSAQYNHGESRAVLGNEVELTVGVASIENGNISVTAQGGVITVAGAAGEVVKIVDASGKVVASTTSATDCYKVAVVPGIYIIKAGNGVYKLVVK